MQTTNTAFLIEPCSFGFNSESAESNAFQEKIINLSAEQIQLQALSEFNCLKDTLVSAGINVLVFKDTPSPHKPDAVFPNNWISVNNDQIVIYPMCNENRRSEKRKDLIEELQKQFKIEEIIDLSIYEKENMFLEGTGSMVFDYQNKIVYACISPRTHKQLFIKTSEYLGYTPICFHSFDKTNIPIYHTNVMMTIGPDFAVICLESITNKVEQVFVKEHLIHTGHEIIDISLDQVNHFAGNMLTLKGKEDNMIVLSENALRSLNTSQTRQLEKHGQLLPVNINTIETIGGGSVRCMITEIFN